MQYYGRANSVETTIDQVWAKVNGPLRFFGAQPIGVSTPPPGYPDAVTRAPAGCFNMPNADRSMAPSLFQPFRTVLSHYNEAWCVMDRRIEPANTCVVYPEEA